MKRLGVAVAVALGLLLTGCGAAGTEPEGDALYAAGEQHYTGFSGGLHRVLMAMDEGTWTVAQKDYGVVPILCAGGEDYFFHAIRQSAAAGVDAEELRARAVGAFEELDVDVTTTEFGTGTQEEWNIIGAGGVFERAVVSIRPATGGALVTARSTCAEGDAGELAEMVFDRSTALDQWRLVPATEGPEWTPQFFFPEGGPLYYEADGTPVDPQPVSTAPPAAPYGR